jgi:hypothetical protein
MTQGGWNLPTSLFANPYKVSDHGLEKCLELYEAYLRQEMAKDPGKWKAAILDLAGKTIGCWCYDAPAQSTSQSGKNKCHGDVIVKVFRELVGH